MAKIFQENSATDDKFKNNQDILSIDINKLYNNFIVPVDAIRSHFNALVPNSQELNTPQYQESRCHTFYRMIGFPVVADGNNFYSPGFDPNLNTDGNGLAANQKIANSIINNLDLTKQFSYREQQVQIPFKKIFAAGGIAAQVITLGSMFIRSFAQQFGNTAPLVDDPNKEQIINERVFEMINVFGGNNINTFTLISKHPLKPFIVDPRIDSTVRPIVNRVCAPFLKDKTQTKVFTGSQSAPDSLKRPYIEKVVTTRFNNNNLTLTSGQDIINTIVDSIVNNKNQTDPDLIKTASDPLNQLYNSELVVFGDYIKIIKILVSELVKSMRDIQDTRQRINFKPISDPKNGIESGTNGNTLNAPDPGDESNNKKIENQLIALTQKKTLNDLLLDTGVNGVSDDGDFVFSNLDDSIFSINKNVQKSYDVNITNLTDIRNKYGTESITSLQTIEIIVGEFSGIGLIDMVAIQAALWIMDPQALLGLIDSRAFQRIKDFRKDTINLGSHTPLNIIDSLTNFEQILKTIYIFIQDYYDGINRGTILIAK
jgi:hypothetical protein